MQVLTHKAPYHHGDLRRALLEASLELVARAGPDGFSLREAARKVGVSATACYRHFADKSAVLRELAAEGFAELARAMLDARDRAVHGRRGVARARAHLLAVGRAYVEFGLSQPARFTLMFQCAEARGRPAARPDGDPYVLLGRALDELAEVGAVTPLRRRGAETKAWSVVHGLTTLLQGGGISCKDAREREVLIDTTLAFVVDGLCGTSRPGLAARASRRRARSRRA